MEQKFQASEPDKVRGADISYIKAREGCLYLSVVIDLFSCRVVGWSARSRMTTDLALQALLMAVWRREPAGNVMAPPVPLQNLEVCGSRVFSKMKEEILMKKSKYSDAQIMAGFCDINRNQNRLGRYHFSSIEKVQDHATLWLWTYNNERPNMGIGGMTPMQRMKAA